MTKKIYLFASVLLSAFYAAQDGNVGINTTQPSVTLDVVGQPANPNKLDGITAQRLTGSQLRSKTYTNLQNGAQVYVTAADPSPAGQTVNVTASGYYYFDGTVWVPLNGQEPWYNVNNNRPATLNTQNIYQTGKVSIGKNATGGILSVYDPEGYANRALIYMNFKNMSTGTTPWAGMYSNIGNGSFSSIASANDMAWVFSVDNDASSYTNNGLLLTAHLGGGGVTPYGLKITEQGMISVNSSKPTESFDVAGTVRVRWLPAHGASNAIYTNPAGGNSVPAATTTVPIVPTQTFTASRSVVADRNGVLGYVEGLPLVGQTRYTSSTNMVTVQPTDGTIFINRPNGSEVNISLPPAVENKNRLLSICAVNSQSNAKITVSNINSYQSATGSVDVVYSADKGCVRLQSGSTAEK